MKTFNSIAEFITHLATLELAVAHEVRKGLERSARLVERTAKEEIGEYQPRVGPFPAWAPLAESTEAEKARHGYPTDAPLLRTGEMRRNIDHEVHGLEAVIGSPDERAVFHEFGTSRMPPRPIFGPAVVRNKHKIQMILGAAVVSGLIGGERVDAALGYDFKV